MKSRVPFCRFANPAELVGKTLSVTPKALALSVEGEKVIRVTATQVVSDKTRYRISDGFEVGGKAHACVVQC